MVMDSRGRSFRLEPIACPTCGVRALRVLGKRGGSSHRYGLGVETEIVQCQRCGLLFPDPFPFPENHEELYEDPTSYFAGTSDGKIDGFRDVVLEAKRRCGRLAPRVLDIGSGQGEFVASAMREGCDVVGLEFAKAMRESAKRLLNVDLVAQTVEGFCETRPAPFDVVTLNAVLEHMYNPDSAIAACRQLLKPNGVLYLDVPNEPNFLTEIVGLIERFRGRPIVYHLAPTWEPYHVFGFNPRAIGHLLTKHGFSIEDIDIRSSIDVPSDGSFKDRAKATFGRELNRLGNWLGRGANMFVWCRRGSL